MTHEPECEIAMSGVNVNDCICGYINHAYQRGREDAAQQVHTELLAQFRGVEHAGHRAVVAAARGDGEPVVIQSPAMDNLRNLKPLWADTPYGRIYFGGDSDCYCEDCNNPDCGCIDCGVTRGDGEQA